MDDSFSFHVYTSIIDGLYVVPNPLLISN